MSRVLWEEFKNSEEWRIRSGCELDGGCVDPWVGECEFLGKSGGTNSFWIRVYKGKARLIEKG